MITEIIKPTIKNSSIKVKEIEKTEMPWTCNWHIHDECEMHLILEGGATYFFKDRSYKLKAGDIVFINSNIPHRAIIEKGMKKIFVHFAINVELKNFYKSLSNYINTTSADAAYFTLGTQEYDELRSCLDNIISENAMKNTAYEDYIIAEIYKIIAILYRYDVIKNPESIYHSYGIDKIMPVLDYIHNHYNENISLNKMSDLINIDKSHLCRLFKKSVNSSLVDYVNLIRVAKAESLLLLTEDGISEIAQHVGFDSSAYFSKVFKKIKSCTPSQYRKYKKADE